MGIVCSIPRYSYARDRLAKLNENLENSWSYEIVKVISGPYWYILAVPLMYLMTGYMCSWDQIRIELIMFPMLF